MNYGKDSVSGLYPRYDKEKVPFGSVLIECTEDGCQPDWYFTSDGRFFYILENGDCDFSEDILYLSSLGRKLEQLGFPNQAMYEGGLEFYPDKILWPLGYDGKILYYKKPVMLPTRFGSAYHTTHRAVFKFNNGIMSGWFFERVKEEKKLFSVCQFKVGDWVIYGKQLNRPDGYGKAARVGGVKFEGGCWQWWKDPVSKHLRRCEDYVVVAHDVEPMPKTNTSMGEAFCRPKYDQTKQNYYRDSVGWIFTDYPDRY